MIELLCHSIHEYMNLEFEKVERGLWHAGQLVLLDESEHPVLGASELVAAPGRAAEGLPGWPRLELFEL